MIELGMVTALYVAPVAGGPMAAVQDLLIDAGGGIVGDRYHGSRHRHVSVQSAGDLEAASDVLGALIAASATRRNITVEGGPIPTQPGAVIEVGPCRLEVVRIAAPCRVMDETIGPGARAALRRRGGVICRAASGGPVAIGDPARAAPAG